MGGGVFTYIYNLSNELSFKYDIYIAYSTRPQTPTNFKSFFNQNIQLIEVHDFKREINFVSDLKSAIDLRKIVNKINPDIIHLHSSKAGAIGRIIFNNRKIPLFYTPHGYSFLMNGNYLKNKFYMLVELNLSKLRCTTISCSLGEHEETLKMTHNARVVNNGINISEIESILAKTSLNTKKSITRQVFTLGRITEQKNPYLFNQIAEAMPNIKFLWIGDGELRDMLTAENIEIKGWLSREDALVTASKADVFLLTSKWEGLPISLLEAMYLKKTCVVSNVIGNKDVIEDKYNGFICNNITDYITAISSNQKLLGQKAHETILSKYNMHLMGEEYNKIYSEGMNKYKK